MTDLRNFRRPFQIVRAGLPAYLAMNAVAYGFFLVGMAMTLLFPDLQEVRFDPLQSAESTESTVEAVSASFWTFAGAILVINVVATALLQIVLPSLIVPFLGIVIFAVRAFGFGVTLAPVNDAVARILVPHSVTLLIELQAYVLVMLGAYLVGKFWLRPSTAGVSTRRQGYHHGLRQLGWLSVPAIALFIVGALYEAYEILYLIEA